MSAAPPSSGDFRALWQQSYGQQLTTEQAEEYEERLTRFVRLIVELEHKERAPP